MGGGQKRAQEQTRARDRSAAAHWPEATGSFPLQPQSTSRACRSNNPFLPASFPAPVSGCGWWGGNGRYGQLEAVLSHTSGGAYPTRSAHGRGVLKRWTFMTQVNSPSTKRPADNPSA